MQPKSVVEASLSSHKHIQDRWSDESLHAPVKYICWGLCGIIQAHGGLNYSVELSLNNNSNSHDHPLPLNTGQLIVSHEQGHKRQL